MKIKIFLIILTIFALFFSSHTATAAPAYGTTLPEQFQFFLGGQTHVVLKRELEQGREPMRSLQHFLLISFGLTDWLSLDLKGGAGDIAQRPNALSDTISYPTYVGGGYGFRLRLHEDDRSKVVFGFQHISIHPYSVFVDTVKHKAVLDDWQLSLLYSYKFDKFTPYVGGKWSRMDYIHWENDQRERVKSDTDKSYGVILGADIPLSEKWRINLEGQLVDVEAVSASIMYQF